MSSRGSLPLERHLRGAMDQRGPSRSGDAGQAPSRRRIRVSGWAFTAAVHLMAFTALFWPYAAPVPPPVAPASIEVSLLDSPRPKPPGARAELLREGSYATAVQPTVLHLAGSRMVVVATLSSPDTSDLLNESALAGATSAGKEGAGGVGCDTARLVQQALRRDPLVYTAVEKAQRLGRAMVLWNGDWVRSGEQDGKGLSAVREAIMWEVAFAPETCRNERVHGLVTLSLADGRTRFVIGSNDWRWSDLLGLRGVTSDH